MLQKALYSVPLSSSRLILGVTEGRMLEAVRTRRPSELTRLKLIENKRTYDAGGNTGTSNFRRDFNNLFTVCIHVCPRTYKGTGRGCKRETNEEATC